MIELNNAGKKYPVASSQDFWALKDVFLDIKSGEATGIIGRNGAGKTTLLNLIAGVLSPSEGGVSVKGKALGLFNLGIGFQDELTGRQNIFLNGTILGASRNEIENKFEAIAEFSELGDFIDMPLGSYSQGMRLRLGFSVIANLDFDILVIDEVLAVGDILFQSKCFERLMDFKRAGKTLVVTNQSVDLIERICDKAVLLEHGRAVFYGNVREAADKYRELLNKERFYAGPPKNRAVPLVENTKKWADDISSWGMKLGSKEAVIDSVVFIDKFGFRRDGIKSGDPLRIRVNFTAKNDIKEPHFGVAIFRKDGVYCYGPNTEFDGYHIKEIKPGRKTLELTYRRVLLAPGEYRFSVAIWDKKEALAFDYHDGYYELAVGGVNGTGELLRMPFKIKDRFGGIKRCRPDLGSLRDRWGKKTESDGIRIGPVKLSGKDGEEKNIFLTNEPAELSVSFKELKARKKDTYLWAGIYREDGVYCQGMTADIGGGDKIRIFFPEFRLLPGGYRISVGLWDDFSKRFLMSHHGVYDFKMAWNRLDHGTVYMDHKWKTEV